MRPTGGPAPALVVALALVWGANWPAMKAGLDAGLPPLWLAALRFALGAACLAPVLLLQGGLPRVARGDGALVLGGALGPMAGFTALACLALTVLPAGPSAVVAYSTPLWVVPAAWLALGERPGAAALVGVAFGLAGLLVMSGPWALDWSEPRLLLGQAALLAAAALWAGSILQVRLQAGRLRTPVLSLVFWQLLLATLVLVLLALAVEGPLPWRALVMPGAMPALLYIGPLGTALAFWMMLELNRRMSATGMAMATLSVPVAGLLLAWALLGEDPSAASLSGAALVLLGLGLAAARPASCPEPRTLGASP